MIEVQLPGGRAAFSTRRGGVSAGPFESLNLGLLTADDPALVAENRRRLVTALGLGDDRIAMGWQVHGADLREWDALPSGPSFTAQARDGAELAQVDAHATRIARLGLLVLVADCLPVALIAPGRAAILHCGWRGLAAGIVERALATFESAPAAVIGPGIGACCYEVGPEVRAAFADLVGATKEGGKLDLRLVAQRKLTANGVSRIEHVKLCTSCRPDLFYSHRRDGGLTGRQGGIVWRD